jgi:predicted transcriptional regulator
MIDGKPYKTLKRHLSGHGLTPEGYRARYNLPASYPMVAPAYSERRREVAMKLGLGHKRGPRRKAKS